MLGAVGLAYNTHCCGGVPKGKGTKDINVCSILSSAIFCCGVSYALRASSAAALGFHFLLNADYSYILFWRASYFQV